MTYTWPLVVIGMGVYMLACMALVKADEREWRDFGIFWLVVLAVIGAAGVLNAAWEILER